MLLRLLSVNGIDWHRLLLLLLFPMILYPRCLRRPREGEAGFRWHARAELFTALLATGRPTRSLLQPASSGSHGSQVFPTHTNTHTHYRLTPSEGSTQAATLSPSVALLLCLTFPMLLSSFSSSFSHISPPFVWPLFPEQNIGGRIQTAGGLGSVFVLLLFEECIDLWAGSMVFIFPKAT